VGFVEVIQAAAAASCPNFNTHVILETRRCAEGNLWIGGLSGLCS